MVNLTEAMGSPKNWTGIAALMVATAILSGLGVAFLGLWLLKRGLDGWRG